MAIKTISMREDYHGIYDHNNVVPGVLSAVLFRAGNIHATGAPDADGDLKGTWTASTTGVEGSGTFAMPANNYNYDLGGGAANYRFPNGNVTLYTEREKSKMTYSVTQEKGLAMYTISLELYVPHLTTDIHDRLQSFRGEPLHAVVTMYDKHETAIPYETDDAGDGQEAAPTSAGLANAQYLLGWDGACGTIGADASDAINADAGFDASTDLDGYFYSDFCVFLDSIEFDSGAAMTDKNGATLKFTSFQGSAPIQLTL